MADDQIQSLDMGNEEGGNYSYTILDGMLARLPNLFAKTGISNIGKLFDLAASELEDLKIAFRTIRQYRDIDQAIGATLDRIGENVQESRGQKSEDLYRQFIKAKIRANLSSGDIETINNVARVFVGDNYAGLEELWNFGGKYYNTEPAGILLKFYDTEETYIIPYEAMDRVVAAGVKALWEMTHRTNEVQLEGSYAAYDLIYPYCGTFYAGQELGGL